MATRSLPPTLLPPNPQLRGRNHGLHKRMIYRMNYHRPSEWWQKLTGQVWALYVSEVQAQFSVLIYLTACQVSVKGISSVQEITISFSHCRDLMNGRGVQNIYLTRKALDWQQAAIANILLSSYSLTRLWAKCLIYSISPLILKTTQWGRYSYKVYITHKKTEL